MGLYLTFLQFADLWNTEHFSGSPTVKSGTRLQSVFFASCSQSVPAQGKNGAASGRNRLRSSLQSVSAQGKNGTALPPIQEVHTRAARALSAEHQTQDQDTSCPNTSSSTRVASKMPKTTSGSGCKSSAFSNSVSNAQSGITQELQEGLVGR